MRDRINAKESLRKRSKECTTEESRYEFALSNAFYSSFFHLFNCEHKLGHVAFLATIDV